MSGQPLRDRPYDPAIHGSEAIPNVAKPAPPRPNRPPPGYTLFCNQMVRDETIDGYLARGETDVVGVCYSDRCRRRCTIDFVDLKRRNLGGMAMSLVQQLLRCNNIDNCRLKFGNGSAPQIEVTLLELNGKPHVRIKLSCQRCNYYILHKPTNLIRRLRADGKGGAETRVSQLTPLMTVRCPRCGHKDWVAGVLWHSMTGIGWHQRGERIFDEMEQPKPPPGLAVKPNG